MEDMSKSNDRNFVRNFHFQKNIFFHLMQSSSDYVDDTIPSTTDIYIYVYIYIETKRQV